MTRRFVNLVASNHTRCMYKVHRLDVSKHLFYASTAKAEAASNEEKRNGGSNGMPTKIGVLQKLPRASMSFPFRACTPPEMRGLCDWPRDEFALLSPRGGGEGRLLHVDVDKEAASFNLYNIDDYDRSTSTIPNIEGRMGPQPVFITVVGEEQENLYVIDIPSFQVLDLKAHPRKWHPLPSPPFCRYCDVGSFAVLDDGGTICVSPSNANSEEKGTYCFDTRLEKWRQAGDGDWSLLPFQGRVEYVPELNTLIGVRAGDGYDLSQPYELCAVSSDLCRTMGSRHRAPPPQHVWEYLKTPMEEEEIQLDERFLSVDICRRIEWKPCVLHPLINLGGGRFCIANVFYEEKSVSLGLEDIQETGPKFVVLTGVEVLRRGAGGGPDVDLRMVKHKSIQYVFTEYDKIECVL